MIKIILITFIACSALSTSASIINDCFLFDKPVFLRHVQTDSFSYYYKILNSVLSNNPYDSSKNSIAAVKYMEQRTGIKAHADGDYFGWRICTKGDLTRWKRWSRKHSGNKKDNPNN